MPASRRDSRPAITIANHNERTDWASGWEEQATSAGFRLWSMLPERGMAVTYPGLANGPVFRWSRQSPWAALVSAGPGAPGVPAK
jgi:hypothetical protein